MCIFEAESHHRLVPKQAGKGRGRQLATDESCNSELPGAQLKMLIEYHVSMPNINIM